MSGILSVVTVYRSVGLARFWGNLAAHSVVCILFPSNEPRLVRRMVQLASGYGRYGYRKVTPLLREEGWRVNHKRIERLWRQE